MLDRTSGEPIVMDLSHSPEVYRSRYRFPFGYLWAYPAAAWAALRETMPWEALAVSLIVSCVSWLFLGSDLGAAVGLSVTLALVTLQMLRTRAFATPFRIVRQRGLFLQSRADIPLAAVLDGRVEYPAADVDSFGDIVLSTAAGEERLRAIRDPRSVLKNLLAMRTSGSAGAIGG
jgi:hypothetical protein